MTYIKKKASHENVKKTLPYSNIKIICECDLSKEKKASHNLGIEIGSPHRWAMDQNMI